jgi:predicted ATPase
MIDEIGIASFKSVRALHVGLGRLTVLTGLNNSGKSTVIQAVRMCCAAAKGSSPYIDGFGGYSDLKSHLTHAHEAIDLKLIRAGETILDLSLTSKGHICKRVEEGPLVQYISADRYGPRVSLPLINEDFNSLTVGALGQYSAHYARIFEDTVVDVALRHPGTNSNIFKHQLMRWMGEISPGVKLEFDVSKRYDTSSLEVDGNRPTNSGFGISYTLPIVLCLLSMTGSLGNDEPDPRLKPWFDSIERNGGMLLLENPEAHLHPRGQTSIGRLIAMAAATGLQILVETHSDHLLDGIRLGVKEAEIPEPEKVRIKYFSKNEAEGTEIEEIAVRADGKLDRWPQGFFDQYSLNLRALAKKNG